MRTPSRYRACCSWVARCPRSPVAHPVPLNAGQGMSLDYRGVDGIPARVDCPGFGNWTDDGKQCVLSAVLTATMEPLAHWMTTLGRRLAFGVGVAAATF